MEVHIPSYYHRFRCLAGQCPHTCCAWWEVPVDPDSAAFYRAHPDALGGRLGAALVRDEEGGSCFRLTGQRCPLLNGEGLCSLQLEWGEAHLPAICREHPRFCYDYGPVREVGLCASCCECARLVLETDFALEGAEAAGPDDPAHPLLFPLLRARETALSLLAAQVPLSMRLTALLLFGNDLQNALDREAVETVEALCAVYTGQLPVLEGVSLPLWGESLSAALKCLKGLERLRAEWTALLDGGLSRLAGGETLPAPPETEGARMAAYFLYRHWLRALHDGDVLSWCELAVLGTVTAGALAPLTPEGCAGTFRRLCLEVEHSQQNLDAMQDALWHRLSLPQLLSLAGGQG